MKVIIQGENPKSAKVLYGMRQLQIAMGDEAPAAVETVQVSGRGWRWFGIRQTQASSGSSVKAEELLGQVDFTEEGHLGREGYQLLIRDTEFGSVTALHADDEQGFLYGLLELAEQWQQTGRFTSKTERAFVPFRGAKCNLPWEPYQEGYSTDINRDVYWDLSVWERYLDRLARGRTNVLMLWSQHPYHLMVKVPKYPEACPFSDQEMEVKIRFWKTLFAMAKERGMEVYMLTWNIHLHEKFAHERGFQLYGQDHPVIRDYLREAVKELIAVYDDLGGFATNPGERMYNFSPGAFEDFILDVYFKALKEAKRQVPFILRSNWLPAEATRLTVEAAGYPGPVFIDWKFNTSHGLSTWKLSGKDKNRFLHPRPKGYKMLWHVRNEEAYILQWGDPEFVRNHALRNYDPEIAEGYFFGPERVIPFLEEVRLNDNGGRLQTYDFDRRWYMYEAWGRMGYNPDTPASYWQRRLSLHYGLPRSSDGSALYEAVRAASRVPLEFNTFWAGSWDGTAYAEGNLGFNPGGDAWDGDREKRFISVTDFIFHECLDIDYMTVPEYIIHVLGEPAGGASEAAAAMEQPAGASSLLDQPADGRVTPFDVARRMAESQAHVRAYLQSEEAASMNGSAGDNREWSWLADDLTVWSGLAGYYRYKIQASTYLYAYMYTGDEAFRTECRRLLELAAAEWASIAEYTRNRYARQDYDHFSVFHWERYVEDAYKDIELAEAVRPLVELAGDIRCFRLGSYASDGWGASMDRAESPERALSELAGAKEAADWSSYLSGTYAIEGREYRWEPIPELSPSLDILRSNRPVQMVKELSKRYDIRYLFADAYGGSGTAYFAAIVRSDRRTAMMYELRTADYARVWLNGGEVFQTPKGLWYTQGRRGGRFPVLLEPGDNLFVIKLEAARRPMPDSVITDREDPEAWGFHLERVSGGYHFMRHHIYPHTMRGLKR